MNQELGLFLAIAIIIVISKAAGHLSQRYLKQPVVFGEILAGLLLGPTLLNIFHWPIFRTSGEGLHETINLLAGIGVLLLMFIAGMETNLDQLRKVGKTAFSTAIWGIILPLGFGTVVGLLFGLNAYESIFIGAVLTATSVSISAQTLMEIGQLHSREGTAILGAAVIDDVLGIIVLSVVIALHAVQGGGGAGAALTGLPGMCATSIAGCLHLPNAAGFIHILVTVLLMAFFFGVVFRCGPHLSRVLAFAERLHASYVIPAAALVLMFLFAVGAQYIGQVAAITGAYLVGIFLGQTHYRQQIEQAIHPFTYALFVPVFFISIGLGANARELGGNLLFTGVIVLVAIFTKIVGCGLGARLTGFTTRESTRVGLGMISRGEVGLIVAQVGLASQVIRTPEYAAMVITVLVSTVVTPILLKLSFPHTQEVPSDVYESVVEVELGE